MARDSGTPTSLHTWLSALRCGSDSRLVLYAMMIDGQRSLVHEWERDECTNDPKAWAEFACTAATADAQARGQATRYELIHYRADAPKATVRLYRNSRGEGEEDDAPRMDGSSAALLQQAQRHNEKILGMFVDMARAQTVATQAQNAAMATAFGMLGNMTRELGELRKQAGIPDANGKRTFDGPVGEMLEIAMPDIVAGVLDKWFPEGFAKSELVPKPGNGSPTPPSPNGASSPARLRPRASARASD